MSPVELKAPELVFIDTKLLDELSQGPTNNDGTRPRNHCLFTCWISVFVFHYEDPLELPFHAIN